MSETSTPSVLFVCVKNGGKSLSVTGLAGPRLSRNVRFEWLHRDSPGRLCQV